MPGWKVKSLDGDRVLLQAGEEGSVGLWSLAETGKVTGWTPVSGPVQGWTVIDLDEDWVILQNGEGRIGVWQLDENGSPALWFLLTGPLSGFRAVSVEAE